MTQKYNFFTTLKNKHTDFGQPCRTCKLLMIFFAGKYATCIMRHRQTIDDLPVTEKNIIR